MLSQAGQQTGEEQSIANSHLNITQKIHLEENNLDFPKAEARLTGIISAYRSQEKQKIATIYNREAQRRPKEKSDWQTAVANRASLMPTSRDTTASTSGRPFAQPKRRRSGSHSSRPAQRRRERSRTPDRRRPRQAPNHRERRTRTRSPAVVPESPGHAALIETLRALLK